MLLRGRPRSDRILPREVFKRRLAVCADARGARARGHTGREPPSTRRVGRRARTHILASALHNLPPRTLLLIPPRQEVVWSHGTTLIRHRIAECGFRIADSMRAVRSFISVSAHVC